MKAQVVYEHDESFDMHVGPYGYSKVGVLIEDRVIWLACHYDTSTFENYLKWEGIAKKIVDSLKSD